METATQEKIEAIREAYEEAKGAWTGCDWPTSHGVTEINLDDKCSRVLRAMAAKLEDETITDAERDALPQPSRPEHLPNWPQCSETLDAESLDEEQSRIREDHHSQWINDLYTGADWLDEVAANAAAAEEEAAEAMAAVERGDLDTAHYHAKRACRIEVEYGDCPTWHGFAWLIEFAAEE